MPEMAVSGAGPFRKRPDYGLDAKMRAKTDDASSNWCSQVGPQVLSPSPSLYRGPIVQLEADLGSMLIIWARAGALQTPLQPPKITLCTPSTRRCGRLDPRAGQPGVQVICARQLPLLRRGQAVVVQRRQAHRRRGWPSSEAPSSPVLRRRCVRQMLGRAGRPMSACVRGTRVL